MNFHILTECDFFKKVVAQEHKNIRFSYDNFIKQIIGLCEKSELSNKVFITLTYTEIELQYLSTTDAMNNEIRIYIHKALAFVRKMLKYLSSSVSFDNNSKSLNKLSSVRWTGTLVDFVELVYGLQEMESISNGNVPLNELYSLFGQIFDMEVKDNQCYNAYTDIKRRKSRSESRTYYLDKMSERLNLRMQRDEERELRRR